MKSHCVPIIASRIALRTRHAARRDGFQARYGLRARLLRAEISLRPCRTRTLGIVKIITRWNLISWWRGGAWRGAGTRARRCGPATRLGDTARRGSFARRARSDALRRVPSSLMREISVRNKISSMARSVISACVIAPAIRSCGPQRRNEPSDTADRRETYIRHRRKGSGNRKGDSAYWLLSS